MRSCWTESSWLVPKRASRRQARDGGGGELGQGRLALGEVVGEKSGLTLAVVLNHLAADQVAQEAALRSPFS